MGGSLGASALNEATLIMVDGLVKNGISIWHQKVKLIMSGGYGVQVWL